MRLAAPPCISGRTSYLRVRLAFHRYPQVIRSVCNLNQFGPSRPVTGAAACPWVAHTVSGLPGATNALFTLGFPVASAIPALTGPRLVTRRVILQKARDHRDTCVSYGFRCVDAVGFRVCFTPLAGVLFTVPSRYCALSVTISAEPWTVVGPASHGVSRAPWYLSWDTTMCRQESYGTVTRSGPPFQAVCHSSIDCGVWLTDHTVSARNPYAATPVSLARHRFRLVPFRSPLLRELFLFLRVLRCFSSPTYLPRVKHEGLCALPHRGCPIRIGPALCLTAAPRSFRCWSPSFVG